MVSEHPLTPVATAFFAAALWGIWWIPIRYLEHLGMDGAWGSVAMNVGAAVASMIWISATRAPFKIAMRGFLGAALVGVAVTTYSVAITMADVVRVILLFYLAPAWSKIIEWAFLGQPWKSTATLALLASLGGAYLVLGGAVSLAGVGLGDGLAILSGLAWAAGAALIFTGDKSNSISLTLVTALSACGLGTGFVLLGAGTTLSGSATFAGATIGSGFGAIYVLPILALTLWSAQRLSPAAISFLLTAEILSGVLSGVWLLDEPFGLMQAGGACLIFVAALSEVLPSIRRSRTT